MILILIDKKLKEMRKKGKKKIKIKKYLIIQKLSVIEIKLN